MQGIKNILISRTDSIGDVVLTLPVAGALKSIHPGCRIFFLGKNYTQHVIALSRHVDEFISWDELSALKTSDQIDFLKKKNIDCIVHVFPRKEIAMLAKKAQIPWRIGTRNRMYHWFSCNQPVALSRKNSDLHESQLNLKLIVPLGAKEHYTLSEIETFYGFEKIPGLPQRFKSLINADKVNIILHPRSKGSAREWGIDNFNKLISQLPPEKFRVFISGTAEEGKDLKPLFENHPGVTDLTGKLSLAEFIAFISLSDIIVAASTGPLHIAAVLGKRAVGLYVPLRPIHPGRWAPIGKHARVVCSSLKCESCKIAEKLRLH
jgi:heptosyltransferase III